MKTLITAFAFTFLALAAESSAKPLTKYGFPLTMTPHAHSNRVQAAARADSVAQWYAQNPSARIGLHATRAASPQRRFAAPALRARHV